MRTIYTLIFLIVHFVANAIQQPDTLFGKVVDYQSQLPIQGATIRWSSGVGQAISDENGHFSIQSEWGLDTLIIRHVGYLDQHLHVNTTETWKEIFLVAANTLLEEVVVNTGYQTLHVNEVTGSVQVLGIESLQQQSGPNILQRIINLTAGIRFDNQPANLFGNEEQDFSIRGLSTINGPVSPLVVLDGFIYEGNIANIDPSSIENVTILKDAAATSIWGARAGNGVVVLTTKKGHNRSGKAEVSIGKSFIVKQKPDMRQLYQMSSGAFIATEEFLYSNGYYDRQISRTPYLAVTPAIKIFHQTKSGLITPADSAEAVTRLSAIDGRDAFQKYFLTNPITDQYSMNVRGGHERHSYQIGGGFTSDRNFNSAKFKKVNLNLSNSFKVHRNVEVDLSIYYTNSSSESGMPMYNSLTYGRKQIPYLEIADQHGEALPVNLTFDGDYMAQQFPAPYLDWNYYPLDDWKLSQSTTKVEEIYANANFKYKPFSFLDINASAQYQIQNTGADILDEEESYKTRLAINQFLSIDPSGGTTYRIPRGGIFTQQNSRSSSYTFRGQANVHHQWGRSRIDGIFGGEVRQALRNGSSHTVYGYSADPLTNVRVDFAQSIRTIPENRTSSIPGAPILSERTNRFVSLYSNWLYMFADRYGFSASMRSDGANIFGAATNDKWRPFWSLGTFWDISKEPFYRSQATPALKIRMTYGLSGNVDLSKTPLPIGQPTSGFYTRYPAILIGALNDPTLRWEKVGTWNAGIDFTMYNGVFSGSVDYYLKNGTDLYGLTPYDYTTWGVQGLITKNAASMRSSGIDMVMDVKNLGGKLNWATKYIISLNKNRTTDYYAQLGGDLLPFLGSGNGITPVVGRPLNAIAAYRWAGLDVQGNPQGYLDGKPSTDYNAIREEARDWGNESGNIVYVGSSRPEFFGSFINTFGYRSFSLSVNISFKAGYYFKKGATSYTGLFAQGTAFSDIEDRWQQPSDEKHTDMPSMLYPVDQNRDNFYQMAELHVLRGDHLRLEYINFSWSPVITPKGWPKSLDVYVNTSNLGILWKVNKENKDPEFSDRLSPLMSITTGLRLTF